MYQRQANYKILFVLLFAVGCRFTNTSNVKQVKTSNRVNSFRDILSSKYSDDSLTDESVIYQEHFQKDYKRLADELGFGSISAVSCNLFSLKSKDTSRGWYIHLGVFQIAFAKKTTLDSKKTIRLEEKVRKYHNSQTYIYYSTYLSKDSTKINILFSSTHLSAPTKELFKILESEQISDFEE